MRYLGPGSRGLRNAGRRRRCRAPAGAGAGAWRGHEVGVMRERRGGGRRVGGVHELGGLGGGSACAREATRGEERKGGGAGQEKPVGFPGCLLVLLALACVSRSFFLCLSPAFSVKMPQAQAGARSRPFFRAGGLPFPLFGVIRTSSTCSFFCTESLRTTVLFGTS
jgi:hypothetical protein